jgi:anthranilate phosphoribosyltransferase
MLNGEPGAYRDVVLLTAGAALLVAGRAADLKDGIALAAQSIDSGKARAALREMIRITNSRNAHEGSGNG